MNSDSYFKIGQLHDVCQDYAISGGKDELSFAVLSDGCSGSPMTDFGSRFLCLGMSQLLNKRKNADKHFCDLYVDKACLAIAKSNVVSMGLPLLCLDATIGYVFADETFLHTFLAGDGVVAGLKKNGEKFAAIINYPSGAPPYSSYLLDEDRQKLYLEKTQQCPYSITTYRWSDQSDKTCEIEEYSGMTPHLFAFEKNEYNLAMVISDGVCSFQKPQTNGTTKYFETVDPLIIIDQLLSIKSPTGDFIKRRCKRIMKELCGKNGWRHLDDISVAGVHS